MTNLPALPPQAAGQLANQLAAASVFNDYKMRKSANTLNQQMRSLSLFARSLVAFNNAARGVKPSGDMTEARDMTAQLFVKPAAWQHITHGQVKAFEGWMLNNGYSVGSINVALSHVRVYAALAHKAGVIEPKEASLIAAVNNIASAAGMNIDAQREKTRVSKKKANFNTLTRQEVQALLDQPDTPRGRRDSVVIATLYYFGTRAEEAAGIQVSDVNMGGGLVHIFRPKVKGTDQAHGVYDLNAPEFAPARQAYEQYHRHDAPPIGMFFRGSIQNSDELGDHPMTRVTISQLVATLGRRLGFNNLSAHDLRHTGATHIAATDNNLVRLRDWGGWNSIQMPARYAKRAKTANEGVRFG